MDRKRTARLARRLAPSLGLLGCVLLALALAGTHVSSAQEASGPEDASDRGIPRWTLHFGGFRSLQDLSALPGGEAWGIDAIETSLAPGRQTQTAFVHVHQGIWRAARFVEGQRLRALDLTGPSFGLAVGDEGAAWRFDGQRWRDIGPAPSQGEDLGSIDMVDATTGWATGRGGTILRWDGQDWQPEAAPFEIDGSEIVEVAAFGGGQAWAITRAGHVLRRDERGWSVDSAAPESRGWQNMAFRTAEHGILAGRSLFELRDGAWRPIGEPDVRYRSPVWLGETALLLADDRPVRYRDGVFSPVEWMPGPLGDNLGLRVQRWLKAVSPTEAWAFGAANSVTRVPLAGEGAWLWPAIDELETVDALPEGLGWAGGATLTHGLVGGGLTGAWANLVPQAPGTTISDVDLLSLDEGWAVGRFVPPGDPLGAEGRMWRWDGEAWRDHPINKLWGMRRVQMLSESEGWASGDNVVVRWDGERWNQVAGAPPEAAQGDLSVVRGGEQPLGFFGAQGKVFRLSGDTWDMWTLPVAELVQAVAAPAADEAWALTRTRLYRFDGQDWTDVTPRMSPLSVLSDAEALGPANLWLLTEPSGLLHWDGTRWTEHDLAPLGYLSTPFRLRALRLAPEGPSTDIWLVGEPAMVARYHLSPVFTRIALPWLSR
jgi:hypothetical protein